MLLTQVGDIDLAAAYAYPDQAERPWLRANMVASVDGAAWHDGKAGGLGNDTDRRLLSLLRGLADVVIVGANTVRVEGYGPVRARDSWRELREGRPPTPKLAIVSRDLDLNVDAPVFASGDTIVITCAASPDDRRRGVGKHAEVIVAGDRAVEPGAALDALADRGHLRQLSEGGPRLLAQFAAAGRVDELCLTLSPLLAAGGAARITNGSLLAEPERLRLGHVLTDDDFLFLRYVRA
jgi:riboflavin biosynthesis pyrimidine reductase